MNYKLEERKNKMIAKLESLGISGYKKEQISDDIMLILFQDKISGTILTFTITISGNKYCAVMARLCQMEDITKKTKILNFLNELNGKYDLFKFYLNKYNSVIAGAPYFTGEQNYNEEVHIELLAGLLRLLEKEGIVKELLRIMYS